MGVIAKYKFNQNVYANFIPEFNSEFTNYTITDEIDTDGYTIRTIESDSLPTLIRFGGSDGSGSGDYTKQKSLLEVNNLNTSSVTSMSLMFYHCRNLTYINTNFDTSKVTDTSYMFHTCSSLTSLDVSNFNTSIVTDMGYMFHNCVSLTSLDLSNFDTSKVISMGSMFRGCTSLTSLNVSNFDTSKVTDMQYMFHTCSSLTSLDLSNFNTSIVTNMLAIFSNCSSLTSLDLSNFNTSNVTSMNYMFHNCNKLTSLDLSNFNTSNVTGMQNMFYNCKLLTSLDVSNFNTSNVTNMYAMFTNCSKLTSLDISNFDTSKVTNVDSMFSSCELLMDIGAIYCDSSTINKIVDLLTTNTTIWYQDAKLNELTPLSNITYKEYQCVEVQQDVDSIPLTSDMFRQGGINASSAAVTNGMSYQQFPQTETNTNRIKSKTIIPVKPNAKYTVNFQGYAIMFDKNGDYVKVGSQITLDFTSGIEFTIPSNIHYIALCMKNSDESAISPSDLDSLNLILQEVPQEIVLRGIGDVKDELDLTRGEYIQRIGEVVLDGSQQESYWTYNDTNKTFRIQVQNAFTLQDSTSDPTRNRLLVTSDKLSPRTYSEDWNAGSFCSLALGQRVVLRIDGIETTSDLIQYLKENPITVQYVLETPIIHKVNLTNTKVIQSYATETRYETITPSDSLIPNITIPSTLNYDVAIKPSTEYTIRANTSDNLTVDLGGATGILSNGKVTLTTPATLTHNEVKFSGTGKVKELMVVEGNEIKDNVPFFNGMKNVEMGGIKLVNIARVEGVWYNVTTNTNKTQYTFTTDVNHSAWGEIGLDDTLLKPNTLYTVMCNITNNTITNTSMGNCMKWQFKQSLHSFVTIPEKFVGRFVTTLISPSEYDSNFSLYFVNNASQTGTITIENPMIIEGDWTHLDEIPFIESEMIIEQPIIRSQGKNLFDIRDWYEGIKHIKGVSYDNNGITLDSSQNVGIASMARSAYKLEGIFKPNTQYTLTFTNEENDNEPIFALGFAFSYTDGTTNATSLEYLGQHTLISHQGKTIESLTLTWKTQTQNKIGKLSNIQLEESSTATSYEPYKHQTLYSNRVIGYEENCYYQYRSGKKADNAEFNSVIADVEGLSVAYVSNAHSNFTFWDKDDVYISGKPYVDTNNLNKDNVNGLITVPTNAKYMKFACYNNSVSRKTDYTKATVTGELPLRSLPNGVCDTLNLVTGEYVQRVGEIVLSGSSNEIWKGYELDNSSRYSYFAIAGSALNTLDPQLQNAVAGTGINDRLKTVNTSLSSVAENSYSFSSNATGGAFGFIVRLTGTETSVNQFVDWLQQNPITVQYELATPIVRKLGFTAKGNYAEVELNGSETWNCDMNNIDKIQVYIPRLDGQKFYDSVRGNVGGSTFSKYTHDDYYFNDNFVAGIHYGLVVGIKPSRLYLADNILSKSFGEVVTLWRQWLSLNPVKVGYLSTNSASLYSNIYKPIFFNNVDVQFLPHNLDIQPQLTLQARTKNSYVMDMMKANTKYSIKLLNSSGNMTIDGTSYTLANNRAFVSPSTLTNKELIISGQWHEPMIIEGDVTGKNLPYFKGILSSYHDVNEIEVYSTNKNLFDKSFVLGNIDANGNHVQSTVNILSGIIEVEGNTTYSVSGINEHITNKQAYFIQYDQSMKLIKTGVTFPFITDSNCKYLRLQINQTTDIENINNSLQLEEGSVATSYIPHAHNTTLIEMPTRLETVKVVRPILEKGSIHHHNGMDKEDTSQIRTKYIPVQPNEFIYVRNSNVDRLANIICYDIDKNYISYLTGKSTTNGYVPDNCYFIRFHMGLTNISDLTITRQAYKPIQLNSLPNGVCDEIIMKPNSNKAQLVQRVGKVVLDGSEGYSIYGYGGFGTTIADLKRNSSDGDLTNAICDKFRTVNYYDISINLTNMSFSSHYTINQLVFLNKEIKTETEWGNYLQQNPITVYYELATPIIHEIQLKGYPHVYENGTVTLNTDTPHQTLVSYNVNQEQLINNQNETIIRHDKQIDDLYYYIEMYLEEIYQMELFRMRMELSL